MSAYDDHDNDPTVARLRAALSAEADMTNPADNGLEEIRARTRETAPRWRTGALLAAAAALIAVIGVGGVLLFTGGEEPGGNVSANQPATSVSPTPSTGTTGTGSASPSPSPMDQVWVYYVQDDPEAGPRLYREQHLITPIDVPPAAAALHEMFTEPAADPDYRSLWPDQPLVRGYQVEGDVATVDLARFVQVGAAFEEVAVQQLVYTVTANDPAVKRVRLLVDGKAPASGHADWSQPVSRAPMVDVQGLIWLLSPTEGAVVSSPVSIDGYGTAFEGTVNWQVRQGDTVVKEGFTQGGSMGEFGEFHDTVDLPPGTYELRAFEYSAKDGTPINIDTKTFTVR